MIRARAEGFSVALEGETTVRWSKLLGGLTESVGWLAVQSGKGRLDGLAYMAGTQQRVGDSAHKTPLDLSFSSSATFFSAQPSLFGSVASFVGGDTVRVPQPRS